MFAFSQILPNYSKDVIAQNTKNSFLKAQFVYFFIGSGRAGGAELERINVMEKSGWLIQLYDAMCIPET